jgi:DNA-binding transcriptional ArsR family regulator
MGDSEDPVGINDKIEILSTDDERIKSVGELLSSDSSRTILKLLFNDQMTANQISQKTGISLPLVIYHLKKMQETGIVRIAQTGKNTKSHDMKYYTVDKFAIVILPSTMTEKARSSKSLLNSFNRIHRFASIGGAAIAAWFSSQFIQQISKSPTDDMMQARQMFDASEEMAQSASQAPASAPEATMIMESAKDVPYHGGVSTFTSTGEPTVDIYISVIVTLGIVVIGLIIERALRARKK